MVLSPFALIYTVAAVVHGTFQASALCNALLTNEMYGNILECREPTLEHHHFSVIEQSTLEQGEHGNLMLFSPEFS